MRKPTTPMFVWGQSTHEIRISVSIPLLADKSLNVSISSDEIVLSAKDTGGRSYILSLELREFVVASNSSWTLRYAETNPLDPKPDGVLMRLQKEISHRWDRLVQTADKVKQFMRKDWVDDDGDVEDDDVDLPSGPNIRKVTSAALGALVLRTSMVVAALRYPWCNKCTEKDRYFAKAARGMKDKEYLSSVSFVVIDVRDEKHLGQRYNMSCDDKCELLIFKQDEPEEPYRVSGKRYVEEIQIDCYKHLLPVVSVIEGRESFERVTSAFDTAIMGFFYRRCRLSCIPAVQVCSSPASRSRNLWSRAGRRQAARLWHRA